MNHKIINVICFVVILFSMAIIGSLLNQTIENSKIIEIQSITIETQKQLIKYHEKSIKPQNEKYIIVVESYNKVRGDLIKVGDFVKPTVEAQRLINSDGSTTDILIKSHFNQVVSIDHNGVATIDVFNSDELEIINVYWLESAGYVVVKPDTYDVVSWIKR